MKTALITGASDGIGEQAARQLAKEGWQVAVIGRNPDKTRKVAQDLGALQYVADFTSLAEVKALADRLLKDFPRIDLLSCNAGGIFPKQALTDDGFEKTFQVNHLAHFLLTSLLLERLIESDARVVSTSSIAHKLMGFRFDVTDVANPKHYNQHLAYGNAKLANILFTKELHRRYNAKGLSAAAYHPGFVATNFANDRRSPMSLVYHTALKKLMFMISPQQGADTLVFLANTTPGQDWQSGQYYVKRKQARASGKANDPSLAQALWDLSEALCAPYLTDRTK